MDGAAVECGQIGGWFTLRSMITRCVAYDADTFLKLDILYLSMSEYLQLFEDCATSPVQQKTELPVSSTAADAKKLKHLSTSSIKWQLEVNRYPVFQTP